MRPIADPIFDTSISNRTKRAMSPFAAIQTIPQPATSETAQLSADMRRSLRDLIVGSLNKKYVSKSSFMEYETGNRYQSVQLGSDIISGYRTTRGDLFQAFNFADR